MRSDDFAELIEKIKDGTDIETVISQRIELKNHKACCPFHSEKTPSFSVNWREQYFYCFGCGAGGDVIKFVQLFDRVSFWEAVNILARDLNIKI